MKKDRRKRIVELINSFDIRTQREITEILNSEGWRVTQATVSRDLRSIEMARKTVVGGRSIYCVRAAFDAIDEEKLNTTLFLSVVGIKYAQNNVVIKTEPGLAAAIAANLDSLNNGCIIGSVAGDDTIIIVTPDETSSEFLSGELCRFIMPALGQSDGAEAADTEEG